MSRVRTKEAQEKEKKKWDFIPLNQEEEDGENPRMKVNFKLSRVARRQL